MSTVGSLYIDVVTRFARVEQDMNKLKMHLSNIDSTASKVGATLNKVGSAAAGMFSIMGAAAAVSTVVAGFRSIVDELDEISKSAARAGMNAEEFAKLKFAGNVSDASVEQITKLSQLLSQSIVKAKEGNKEFTAMFKALNVDISGDRRTFDILVETAKVLSTLEEGYGRTAIAKTLFGRAGADAIPFLITLNEELDRQNVKLSSDTAAAAEVFNDNFTRMRDQAKLFGYSIAADVLPMLVQVTSALEKLGRSDKFRNSLKTSLYGTFPELGFILNSVGLIGEATSGKVTKPTPKATAKPNPVLDTYLKTLKAEEEAKKRQATMNKEVAEAKRIAAERKRIAEQIASAEEDITTKIIQNKSEKYEYELYLLDQQAKKYKEIGAAEIKIAQYVASETKRIQQEKADEDAKWKSESMRNYANAIARMIQDERQLRESDLTRGISDIEFKRSMGTGDDATLIKEAIGKYQELLAEQEKWLSEKDKNKDTSGWIAQQVAIDNTRQAILTLTEDARRYSGDILAAFDDGYSRYLREMPTVFTAISDGNKEILEGIEDGWTTLFDDVLHGKIKDFGDYFESVGNRMLQMIEEIIVSATMNSLMGKSGGWGDLVGSIIGAVGSASGGGGGGYSWTSAAMSSGNYSLGGSYSFHGGGLVGDLPKFHGGGLASDEVPAILKKKERVLTDEQNKLFEKFVHQQQGQQPQNIYNINLSAIDTQTGTQFLIRNIDTIMGGMASRIGDNHPMRRGK